MRARVHPSTALERHLRRTFLSLLTGLVVMTLILTGITWLMLARLQPDVQHDTDLTRTLRQLQSGMFGHNDALQSWLATADPVHLDVARDQRIDVQTSTAELATLMGRDAAIDSLAFELRVAETRWWTDWAEPVERLDPTTLSRPELGSLIDDGRVRFGAYREVQEAAIETAAGQRDEALETQRLALEYGLGLALAVAVAIAWTARRTHRRLIRSLASPVEDLLEGLRRVAAGEPAGTAQITGPLEFQELGRGLETASDELRRDHAALLTAQERTQRTAAVLSAILEVAREIAGSLNVRYVAESVSEAACRIAEVPRAVVWLAQGDSLVPLHDTATPRGTAPDLPSVAIGDPGVGCAARDARAARVTGDDDAGWAFPLVVGGRVIGVLQLIVGDRQIPPDLLPPLETLAIHSAAAVEAARLHHEADELAQIDALTRLFNRRRLEHDLAAELERSRRYERPLACIMLDLDHFKVLNDTHGHLHGDEVLRIVAETLGDVVRGSDTVYRYGGEEFVVLLRESGMHEALALAERIRQAIETRFADATVASARVTASLGAAAVPEHGTAAIDLLASADRALYAAKRGGRNRTVAATLPDGRMLAPSG